MFGFGAKYCGSKHRPFSITPAPQSLPDVTPILNGISPTDCFPIGSGAKYRYPLSSLDVPFHITEGRDTNVIPPSSFFASWWRSKSRRAVSLLFSQSVSRHGIHHLQGITHFPGSITCPEDLRLLSQLPNLRRCRLWMGKEVAAHSRLARISSTSDLHLSSAVSLSIHPPHKNLSLVSEMPSREFEHRQGNIRIHYT